MTSSKTSWVKGILLIVFGLAIGAGGIYVGQTDDSPGAGVGGLVLMTVAIFLGIRTLLRKKPSLR
jgi:hypothetical protein